MNETHSFAVSTLFFAGRHDFKSDLNLEKVRVNRYNLRAFPEKYTYKHRFMTVIVKYRLHTL